MKKQPTPNTPKTPQQPPQPTMQEMEQRLTQLSRQNGELCQMLWEAVRKAAPDTHRLELPPKAGDPLWLLAFNAGSDGKVELLAGTHLEITEQEKKRVVRLLRGTATPIQEAIAQLGLPHPPAYVEAKIADRIAWKDGTWISVTPPTLGERIKSAVKWPA
jgi:hypothetical protein